MQYGMTPFGTIVVCGFMYTNFMWEYKVLDAHYQKPKKPWTAKAAGRFFVIFFAMQVSLSRTPYIPLSPLPSLFYPPSVLTLPPFLLPSGHT